LHKDRVKSKSMKPTSKRMSQSKMKSRKKLKPNQLSLLKNILLFLRTM